MVMVSLRILRVPIARQARDSSSPARLSCRRHLAAKRQYELPFATLEYCSTIAHFEQRESHAVTLKGVTNSIRPPVNDCG